MKVGNVRPLPDFVKHPPFKNLTSGNSSMIDRIGLNHINKPSYHHQSSSSIIPYSEKNQVYKPQSPQKYHLGESPDWPYLRRTLAGLQAWHLLLEFSGSLRSCEKLENCWEKRDRGERCKRRGVGGFSLGTMAKYRCGWKGGSGEGDFDASTVTGSFDSVLSVHLILPRDADCVTGRDDVTEWMGERTPISKDV